MPTNDRVGLHDDQGRSPIRPRLGEQDPEQSIARAELRTPDRAPENRQLVTQCHVLERDGSVSTTEQPERSKQHDKRGQHALSCRPIDLRIKLAGRSSFGEPHGVLMGIDVIDHVVLGDVRYWSFKEAGQL
jgi:hypothetical protein